MLWLVILVTMVYGPIAAFLVELFPARIRYSSMSMPYHIGNGWFGGGVPFIGTAIREATGIALGGLFYPMAVAAIGIIVSLKFIREPTHRVQIWDEVGGAPPLVPDQEVSVEYVPPAPEVYRLVPPTESTLGEVAGHWTPAWAPLSPAAAMKVTP